MDLGEKNQFIMSQSLLHSCVESAWHSFNWKSGFVEQKVLSAYWTT